MRRGHTMIIEKWLVSEMQPRSEAGKEEEGGDSSDSIAAVQGLADVP